MMITGNINLSEFSINGQINASFTQKIGIDAFIDELLKLLNSQDSLFNKMLYSHENKDLASDALLLPAGIFPFAFIIQNQLPSGEADLSIVKSDVLNLIKEGKTEIKDLLVILEQMKLTKTDTKTETFNPNVPSSTEDFSLPKDFTPINSVNPKPEISQILKQTEAELDKTSTVKNAPIETFSSEHRLKENPLNFEDSISKLNTIHTVHNFSNISEETTQKIELPFSNLQQVSDIVFKAVSTSKKLLTVQLEPPELGRILIRIFQDSSGIKADMKVDYPHVKDALTSLIPEIKNNLETKGIKVSDFLLDLLDRRGYSNSYNQEGQRRNKGNQKFFEYFV